MDDKNKQNPQNLNRNVNLDTTRVEYSDDISMTISKYGVVFDFGQRLANTNQVQVIARVGVSKEFAKDLLKSLNDLLVLTEGQVQLGKTKEKN